MNYFNQNKLVLFNKYYNSTNQALRLLSMWLLSLIDLNNYYK